MCRASGAVSNEAQGCDHHIGHCSRPRRPQSRRAFRPLRSVRLCNAWAHFIFHAHTFFKCARRPLWPPTGTMRANGHFPRPLVSFGANFIIPGPQRTRWRPNWTLGKISFVYLKIVIIWARAGTLVIIMTHQPLAATSRSVVSARWAAIRFKRAARRWLISARASAEHTARTIISLLVDFWRPPRTSFPRRDTYAAGLGLDLGPDHIHHNYISARFI